MLTFIDMTTAPRSRSALPSLSGSHAPTAPSDDVLDAMGAVVVELSPEGHIQLMNRACVQLVGASLDDMAGRDVRMLFANPEDMQALTHGFEALRAGDASQINLEMHWLREDAPSRLLEGTCTARRNPRTGAVEALVLVGIDVTERRGMERDMTALNTAERREVSESLHESLGMQLAATAMRVQNLKAEAEQGEACSADDLAAIADSIRDGVAKARMLSNKLLPVSLQQDRLIEALSDLAREADYESPAQCTFEADENVPAVRHAAAAMHLHRIAQEAVSNAQCHATPAHIGIRLRTTQRALVLTIRNDGASWNPTEHAEVDTGKGLARMRYRAHLIGATLRIDHSQGVTTVMCRLPLRNTEDA